MVSKQQERAALEQIREIVRELGENSYVGTAFTGVFDAAESNIDYDAAFSPAGEAEMYQKELQELQTIHRRLEADEASLRNRVQQLEAELEREQDWAPYTCGNNVNQADYEGLASCVPNAAHYMTDEEAKDWICGEFDFERGSITIIHEIDEEEVSRHRRVRRTGKKIDRRPIYCATDYHYIRFNTKKYYYEVWNDNLRPFYD